MLATSLLKSDDPFLVFDTPTNISDNDVAWPIEEELEKLLSSSGGEFLTQESLSKVSDFNLPNGFKILCAYVSSYTNKMDVEYFSAFRPKANAMNLKRKPHPFSFNGRLLSLRFDDIPHPIGDPKSQWMSWRAGGLSEYSAIQMMPASFVIEELKLVQSSSDPRCWLNESSETVLKLEQFTGPIRSEVFEPYFRQPKVQRWLIREVDLNKLLASRDLEFKKWVDRSDYERPR